MPLPPLLLLPLPVLLTQQVLLLSFAQAVLQELPLAGQGARQGLVQRPLLLPLL
jgi:hypothetical protein